MPKTGIAVASAALLLSSALTTASLAQPQSAAPPNGFGDLRWRLVGPFRGGWSTMVVGVPDRPDTFYFGGAGGGLWRTENAGRTWTSVFDGGQAASIGAIAVAPSDPNVIYVGTGQPEPRYDVAAGLGLYRSSDGGRSWTALGLQQTRYIGRIWVDPREANTVLVGAVGHFFGPNPERGLFRSTDGGRTWTQTLKINDDTGVVDIVSDPADPNLIFAAAWQARQYPWQSYFTPVAGPGSGVYKSTDGGVTWARLDGEGWPPGPLGRIDLAATRTPAGLRLYATIDSEKAGGLYRSDDGGAHWVRANKESAITNWYFSRLTVDPRDPDVVYAVGQSVRRCTEAGASCEIIKGSPGGDDYHFVWINPKRPDHMAVSSDQGTVISLDGGRTWSTWYNQPTAQFYHLAADNRFPYWIYSGQQDSGTVGIASRSDYGSISFRDWHPVGGDERDYDIPDPADPLIVYGSGLGGHVSRYDSHTGQVAEISPYPVSSYGKRPTLVKYRYNWVTPLVASRSGPPAIYLGAQVLFRSYDQGRSWQVISPDLTGKEAGAERCDGDVAITDARACGYGTITEIEPSARHPGEIWVGTDDGLIQLTRDGGASWRNVTPPALPAWEKVSSLDVSDLEDGVAYAAIDGHRLDEFQPHALVTHNYGATWRDISAGLPRDHLVSVVRADPRRAGLLYAGTDAGVFVSFDDGAHWTSLQQNLPTAWVRDLLVHGDDLIAATQGRSIWALDDVTPLRQLTPDLAARPAHLFAPATAYRVRPDNNRDTPLPPETPVGQNPPVGAVIDYWLGAPARGPVVLEIRDGTGALVQRFSSAETPERAPASRYFAAEWLRPPERLSAAPGLHRFVWNLRWPRPPLISGDYSIAAVYGQDTPVAPEGPLAVPGLYHVTLTVDGRSETQSLTVVEDPRVQVSPEDLRASLAFSQEIAAALAQARRGYGETRAIEAQVKAATTRLGGDQSKGEVVGRLKALETSLSAKPKDPNATFEAVAGVLTALEAGVEGADAAPTQAQREVLAESEGRLKLAAAAWVAEQAGFPELNRSLERAGAPPLRIPPEGQLKVEPPDDGQDLP